MIDIRLLTRNILDANRAPVPGNVAEGLVRRAVAFGLGDCWDDCVSQFPANVIGDLPPNPYRLALNLTGAGLADEPDDEPAGDPRHVGWQDVTVTDEMRDAIEGKSNPERDDRQRHMFVTTTDDAELIAMQIVVQALDGLEPRTQQRVIRYVSERIA